MNKLMLAAVAAFLIPSAAVAETTIEFAPQVQQVQQSEKHDYDAEIADKLRQIEVLETTKAESRAEYEEKRRQIAVLEDRIGEMRSVQEATAQSAADARKASEAAGVSAENAETAKSGAIAAESGAKAAESNLTAMVTTVSRWLMGNILILIILIGAVIYVARSFATFKQWVQQQIALLGGRVSDLEARHLVKISKISLEEDKALRTLLPADMKQFRAGENYQYFIRVNDVLVCYPISLRGYTDRNEPLIGHEYDNKGVTPKHFHKKLAELIEANEGAHPHTVYQS